MQAGAKLRRRRPCNGTRWLVTMIALGAVATSTARMTVSGLVLDINGNPVPQARVILARLPEVTAKTLCSACGRVHEWTKRDAWLADGGAYYRATFRAMSTS